MASANEWVVEGSLGKQEYVKTGVSKTGNPWMIQSISVYAGKDKKTGKTKYDRIGFFVPKDDQQKFASFPDGQKIRLKGRPQANAYINKEGDLITSLNIQTAWEDYYELLDEEMEEIPLFDDPSEPF